MPLFLIFTCIYRFKIWLQLFWYPTLKTVKHEHNENVNIMKLNQQSEKYSENINESEFILWCPKNNCRIHLKTKFRTIITRHPTFKVIKCYNLETTFQKKINFSLLIRFIGSFYLRTFQIPVPAALIVTIWLLRRTSNKVKGFWI